MARATDHELVSKISVSTPPRFMLSVCREPSKTAGLCSRTCMKLPNRIAKMTESAPIATQTPSTPGRRLGVTPWSVLTTSTLLIVDKPRGLVFGLDPIDSLDDVVRQRRDPDEPGEERDPEADHTGEAQRASRHERDCTDREERRKGDPTPPDDELPHQLLLALVAHEHDADRGDLQRGDKVRQVEKEPAHPIEHVHDAGSEVVDLVCGGQPNRQSHHDGCTGDRPTHHLELGQQAARTLDTFHHASDRHTERHVESGHRDADAQRNQQRKPEIVEMRLDLFRRRAGREWWHVVSNEPPEYEDREEKDRTRPRQNLPGRVVGAVRRQVARGGGSGFGVYCHRALLLI